MSTSVKSSGTQLLWGSAIPRGCLHLFYLPSYSKIFTTKSGKGNWLILFLIQRGRSRVGCGSGCWQLTAGIRKACVYLGNACLLAPWLIRKQLTTLLLPYLRFQPPACLKSLLWLSPRAPPARQSTIQRRVMEMADTRGK